ncbi:MAG: hypothetical protein B7Z47_01605 [Chthoniobacter sp. 12-60-6]|nr:MAG: hypothetical protein B7Z47_01605 [Chthoniobacter sp. 12-60-6]
MKAQTEFIEWLRDAYAMEKGMELTLAQQRDDESAPPVFREQAAQHCIETQRHAEAVEACLRNLGADVSTLKTGFAQGVEFVKNADSGFARDGHVRHLLMAYASEHFEIACYTALRTGAERLGLVEFAQTCGQIIDEERRMAEWIEKHLPQIVSAHLDFTEMHKSPAQKARRFVEDIMR